MKLPGTAVLIVDDDAFVGGLLVRLVGLLEPVGSFTPTWVKTAAEAVRAVTEGDFELVLLDYKLPDADGLTVLSEINSGKIERPPVVIMMTGGGNERIAVEAMKRGAKDYIAKGAVDMPTMRRSIQAALERRRLEAQLAVSMADLRRRDAESEADLRMAREVQQALLPHLPPVLPPGVPPERSAVKFTAHWEPCHHLAGDLYEFVPVSGSAVGVLVADVMGHGVRAALIAALMRGFVREVRGVSDRPDRFLAELNTALRALLARIDEVVFVTAVYLVVDIAREEVRAANAGHPAPVLLRRHAGEVVHLQGGEGCGPALGLIDESTYPVFRSKLDVGDAVLAFTDGLIEAANAAGEEFGYDRLEASVRRAPGQTTVAVVQRLLAEVREFRAAECRTALDDDVCVVGVDYKGWLAAGD